MTPGVALRLGRVSNLPTVWSNIAAGLALAGGDATPSTWLLLLIAASAFYVGGMFLNDAYDASVDARERPERPIPSGQVTRHEVLAWGYGWLAIGLGCVALVELTAVAAGLATCTLIVLYDVWHKDKPLAPLIMGLCRVGLYLVAASCAGGIGVPVLVGGALLLSWVVGLTYVARHEIRGSIAVRWPAWCLLAPILLVIPSLWRDPLGWLLLCGAGLWLLRSLSQVQRGGPQIRTAVGSLIAGISLIDALLILGTGRPLLALCAVGAFGMTLALQRWVSGT